MAPSLWLAPGPFVLANDTVIAFAVTEDLVLIVGIFHSGRNYESTLGLED